MQERAQFTRCVLLHRGQDVRVDSERDLDSLVAEALLHDLRRHARLQQ